MALRPHSMFCSPESPVNTFLISTRLASATVLFGLISMHMVAIVLGILIEIWGVISLGLVGVVVWMGPTGYVYDEHYSYSTRLAAAFALLPIPLGLTIGAAIIARWGFAG